MEIISVVLKLKCQCHIFVWNCKTHESLFSRLKISWIQLSVWMVLIASSWFRCFVSLPINAPKCKKIKGKILLEYCSVQGRVISSWARWQKVILGICNFNWISLSLSLSTKWQFLKWYSCGKQGAPVSSHKYLQAFNRKTV